MKPKKKGTRSPKKKPPHHFVVFIPDDELRAMIRAVIRQEIRAAKK